MARAALFDTTPDGLQQWAQEMSSLLSKTILFNTHPTAGGSADAGPIFRANPTQVVAYELFSTTRHIASDAQEGDAASVTLFRAVSIDPTGEPELFTTVSGGNGTAHIDTDMRYLIDDAVAGQQGLSVTYHTTGGTSTDNTMPGIFQVPISLSSFGETPEVVIEEHTHEDGSQGGTLGRGIFPTATISFAGSISQGVWVTFILQPRGFFPMIHTTATSTANIINPPVYIAGYDVDGASGDAPRLGMFQDPSPVVSNTYDLDQRYITG